MPQTFFFGKKSATFNFQKKLTITKFKKNHYENKITMVVFYLYCLKC